MRPPADAHLGKCKLDKSNRKASGELGWRDARLTCPQVEGETGFNQIWGVALGAVPPYGSAVCAAVRGGRHQTEPVSGGTLGGSY